jgi:hypothetical protein
MKITDDTHTSIRIVLPRQRCGEVRDVIGVLSVLDDVYNHLYVWHELAGVDGSEGEAHDSRASRSLPDITDAADVVPADRRLCLARIEVEPPAFIEVVGARYPLEMIYNYLRARDGRKDHRSARTIEKIEAMRGEIDYLWGSNFSESEIREAVSRHVIAPFKRFDRLEGIEIYDRDDSVKSPPRRGRPDRAANQPSPLAREH